MRAMLISLFIITFCLTWNMMLEFNELIYNATDPNTYLFPTHGAYSPLNNVSGVRTKGEYRDSLQNIIAPMEQITDKDIDNLGFMGWVVKGGTFIYNTFMYSTVNFDDFAEQNLYVPSFIADIMMMLVMASHAIGMVEFVSGRVFKSMS